MALVFTAFFFLAFNSFSPREDERRGDFFLTLQEQIDSLTLHNASLSAHIDSLNVHVATLKDHIASLNDHISSLNDHMASLAGNQTSCQQSFQELNGQAESLLKKNEKAQDTIRKLTDDVEQCKAQTPPPCLASTPNSLEKRGLFDYNPPRRNLLPCPRDSGKMVTVTDFEGGYADRIKGMVNAYIIALLSGRGFYFTESILFDNAQTMQVGVCDWKNDPVSTPHDAWRIRVVNVRPDKFFDTDFKSHESQQVWNVHSNMPFGDEVIQNPQFSGSLYQPDLFKSHQEGKLFHQAMRSLFKPSKTMEEMIQSELAQRNPGGTHFMIGIHLRAGDGRMGAKKKRDEYRFTHSHDYRMVPDAGFSCFVQEALVAWNELSIQEQAKYPAGPLYYISSDYPTGENQLKDQLTNFGYPVFDVAHLAGQVKHMYGGGDQSRTFVDWWFLTKSQKMVISVSGYSEIASKYDCVPVSFFVNHPTLKRYNDFAPENCVHHFIRMRGDGLCVPEMDDDPLYEYMYYRYT